MDAADKLRRFLTDKGLTQDEFAAKYGIPQATVSAWVKRRKRPSWAKARELQRLTGIKAERWLDVVIVPLPRKKEEAA
jgi:transcriptional regulator with XRE-family HTH domain